MNRRTFFKTTVAVPLAAAVFHRAGPAILQSKTIIPGPTLDLPIGQENLYVGLTTNGKEPLGVHPYGRVQVPRGATSWLIERQGGCYTSSNLTEISFPEVAAGHATINGFIIAIGPDGPVLFEGDLERPVEMGPGTIFQFRPGGLTISVG